MHFHIFLSAQYELFVMAIAMPVQLVPYSPIFVDQLDTFVGTVVRITIIHDNIKTVIFAAHVNHQCQWIADAHRTRYTAARNAITVSNFHVALGWAQCEHHWITGGHSTIHQHITQIVSNFAERKIQMKGNY